MSLPTIFWSININLNGKKSQRATFCGTKVQIFSTVACCSLAVFAMGQEFCPKLPPILTDCRHVLCLALHTKIAEEAVGYCCIVLYLNI